MVECVDGQLTDEPTRTVGRRRVCVCVCVCVNHVALLAQLQSDLIVTVTSWRDDFAFSELATWPASDTLTRDIE